MGCTRLGLTGTTFKAQCVADNLAIVETSVNLSKCISNQDGHLKFSGAAYERSCSGCLLQDNQTNLDCTKCWTAGNKKQIHTRLNVANALKIKDGKITNCGTASNKVVKQPPPPAPKPPKRFRNDKMERDPFIKRRRF